MKRVRFAIASGRDWPHSVTLANAEEESHAAGAHSCDRDGVIVIKAFVGVIIVKLGEREVDALA